MASFLQADPAFAQHAALDPGSCRATRHLASAALHARQPICQFGQTAACTRRQPARCKRRRRQVSHQHMVEAYVAQVRLRLTGRLPRHSNSQMAAYKQPALMKEGCAPDTAAAVADNRLTQDVVSAPDLQRSWWSRDKQQLTLRVHPAGASRAAGAPRAVCQFPGARAPAPGTHAVRQGGCSAGVLRLHRRNLAAALLVTTSGSRCTP